MQDVALVRRFDKSAYVPRGYNDGAEGMIKWVEDKVYVPIYPYGQKSTLEIGAAVETWVRVGNLPRDPNPKTGKSYWDLWEEQKIILRQALEMKDGFFLYTLIVLCWMRGEGKSLLACLIQLWKFFCWPGQKIMLGANSKDQVKFVHYDIMREIIINSPDLVVAVGEKNIQEKEIRIKYGRHGVDCVIRSISTMSGIKSNITGYTFSEMFDMKNPRFFVQLDGSVRNIPNALGVIDSTVSDKTHVLHQLFKGCRDGTLKTVFFSYRRSVRADPMDYWNPNMDDIQLNDYKVKFPFGEFERYFQNLWDAGTERVFTEPMVDAMGFYGADGGVMNHLPLMKILEERHKKKEVLEDTLQKGFDKSAEIEASYITELTSRLRPVDDLYDLVGHIPGSYSMTLQQLEYLSDLLDTDWALLVGLDMGDPTAVRGQARSILNAIVKGLPRSRSDPFSITMEIPDMKFVYFLLLTADIPTHDINEAKRMLDVLHEDMDGIDVLCSERYGSWDMTNWCEERGIELELIFPNYGRQKEAFTEIYNLAREGRYKMPIVPIQGSKTDNLAVEELKVFDHDTIKKWFGSPEKMEKGGIQDDFVYSKAWTIYGGRMLGPDSFRIRKSVTNFGIFHPSSGLVGNYD
ncbi:MAG: hypothetical protein ACXACY_14790 [Candidatus Hodarchaeales archaeon]